MRKMPKSLQKWLTPRLRRISLWWPGKSIARDNARVRLEVGKTSKGKPILRTYYRCAKCEGFFKKEDSAMDHRDPIVNVEGFKNWDELINKLFCPPEGYDLLCHSCHAKKTKGENKQRLTHRKK